MHIYQQIYEFAASAGAFEGYVYRRAKTDLDAAALANWADNLLNAYQHFPGDVVAEFQFSCNRTLGRAIRSLISVLGEKHEVVGKLKEIVKGKLPQTPDDFQKQKWFQEWILPNSKKKYHENTKSKRHEIFDLLFFSCFRDYYLFQLIL